MTFRLLIVLFLVIIGVFSPSASLALILVGVVAFSTSIVGQ